MAGVFSGRTPWPIQGYPAPPAGGPGGCSPRMVAKFKILKRFEALENDSIFQQDQHFYCQKNLLRKSLRCLTDFTKISEFFHKIILEVSIFMEGAYKSRENSSEFSYLVEKFVAKNSKNFSGRGLLEMV